MFDEFAARVMVDLQGSLGGQMQGLLSQMVTDLRDFGQILGNMGHALLNFASAMPGLAHTMLTIADAVSSVILAISSLPSWIITAVMALEEFYRWGGLALNLLVRLAGAPAAMAAWYQGANFIRSFGTALMSLVQGGALAIQWVGQMVGKLSSVIPAAEGAGTAIKEFSADMYVTAGTLDPMLVAGIAAAAAGIGYLIYKLVTATSATQQWIAASSAAVAKASDLQVLGTVNTQLADTITRLTGAEQNLAVTQREVSAATFAGRGAGEVYAAVMQSAQAPVSELTAHLQALLGTAHTVETNTQTLANTFHTSLPGAMALRSLSNCLRHQAAGFFCAVSLVSMVVRGLLIQAMPGSLGATGCRPRNRSGRAA
jgi:hypothetical protein